MCTSEQDRISSVSYVPPKPSRREPLNRMVTDKNTRKEAARDSTSPKPSSNTSYKGNISAQTSSDENDEEYQTEDDSNQEHAEGLYPKTPELQESSRHRSSSTFRLNSPKLEAPSKKPHRKSSVHCDSGLSQQQETPLKYSKMKSTEGAWATMPLVKYGILILIFAVIGYMLDRPLVDSYVFRISHSEPPVQDLLLTEQQRIIDFKSNIKEIKNKFPGQNRGIWGPIEAGVIDIINGSEKPWIFILFSNETEELSCFAKMLGKASSKAVRSKDSLELQPEDLGDDYGIAIDNLQTEITVKKVVVVHNLLNINPKAIQAFHTMCDRENPLVKGAIYVLTIVTRGNIPEYGKGIKFVEDQLTNRFLDKVPEDKLQPLITRLTDGPIILVKPEIGLTGCL